MMTWNPTNPYLPLPPAVLPQTNPFKNPIPLLRFSYMLMNYGSYFPVLNKRFAEVRIIVALATIVLGMISFIFQCIVKCLNSYNLCLPEFSVNTQATFRDMTPYLILQNSFIERKINALDATHPLAKHAKSNATFFQSFPPAFLESFHNFCRQNGPRILIYMGIENIARSLIGYHDLYHINPGLLILYDFRNNILSLPYFIKKVPDFYFDKRFYG